MRARLDFDRTVERLASWACQPDDAAHTRADKAHFTLAMLLIVPAGLIWAGLYAAFGETTAALSPLAYSVLSGVNIVILRRTGHFRSFQTIELGLILLLPFVLQLQLGGYVGGSAVVIWALQAPLAAALFTAPREAMAWFGAFVAAVVLAAVLQPVTASAYDLGPNVRRAFFAMNILGASAVAFVAVLSVVRARSRLRVLEVAYLDQTVMLRQREKLATLGTLSAGLAHELNNPAAAVRSAARQLPASLDQLGESTMSLLALPMTDGQRQRFADLVRVRPAPTEVLSALQRSALEDDVEQWLDDHGVPEPWEVTSLFVGAGIGVSDLEHLGDDLSSAQLIAACLAIAAAVSARLLAADADHGSSRISEIVAALRSYSYVDRGELHSVNVVEGLESTLVLLRSKLADARVVRDYEPGLPDVLAHGGELNQVWTNLLDNAVDAVDGVGTVTVRAFRTSPGDTVTIEVEDDGPGMSPEVAAQVFDAFFTTKPPGRGTGLGLNISHGIVVNKHAGEISVRSQPGSTCFQVRLPLQPPPTD